MVEWLYAFDVHANAFFCSFFVTYVLQVHTYVYPVCIFPSIIFRNICYFPLKSLIKFRLISPYFRLTSAQYFLLPLLLGNSALSCLVSNTLYAASTVWYFYITYLGYRSELYIISVVLYYFYRCMHVYYYTMMYTSFGYFSTSVLLFSLVVNIMWLIHSYNIPITTVFMYICYVIYNTALPFLGNTQVYLWYPIVATGFLWLLSITLLALGLKVNLTHIVMGFHYGSSSGSESGR